jgi:hypothetical protein
MALPNIYSLPKLRKSDLFFIRITLVLVILWLYGFDAKFTGSSCFNCCNSFEQHFFTIKMDLHQNFFSKNKTFHANLRRFAGLISSPCAPPNFHYRYKIVHIFQLPTFYSKVFYFNLSFLIFFFLSFAIFVYSTFTRLPYEIWLSELKYAELTYVIFMN